MHAWTTMMTVAALCVALPVLGSSNAVAVVGPLHSDCGAHPGNPDCWLFNSMLCPFLQLVPPVAGVVCPW